MSTKKILIRYSVPTRFDKAPFGTIACLLQNDTDKYYIQVNNKPDKYTWLTIEKFFETLFSGYITNQKFMENCLNLFIDKDSYFLDTDFIKKR